MNRIFLSFFLTLQVILVAQHTYSQIITIHPSGRTQLEMTENNLNRLGLVNTIQEINTLQVSTPYGTFTELMIQGYTHNEEPGYPQVPVTRRLIEIPSGAGITVNVLSSSYQDFQLTALGFTVLLPCQPPVIKNPDVPVTFRYDTLAYQQNTFTPAQLVTVDELGFLRGLRLGRINLFPVQYNPKTQVIRVYDEIVLEVLFDHPDLLQTRANKQKNTNPYFSPINNSLLNPLPLVSPLDTLVQYPIKYVIVSPSTFQSALQPFIQWKRKKGFTVIEAYTSNPAVGTTTTSIKSYLQGLYNAGTPADPPPSFVLFVGDVAQVPAFTGTTGSHPTDLYYCEYTNDLLPEVFYGRFSATNEFQLQPQIDKTLEYEQYTMPDPSFLNHCVMVAGVDATFGPTHANGQINYGTSEYFNLAHGLTSHTYLYPASGSQSAQIIQDVSNGCGFANYTAHGSSSGWANPSFTTTNVPSLTNAHKYPLMVGNACLTNKFNDTECFGEALLRAADKGALGYIGASNNTYWDEDYYWAVGAKPVTVNPSYLSTGLGSYDRTFHDHGEPYSQWFMSQGQMVFAGNLAVDQGAPSSSAYYWEVYHLMGDPSLMVYYSQPPALTASYASPLPLVATTFTVTTEPYAYAALSMGGVLHGAAQANSLGIANISVAPFTGPGTADVVITKQNFQPYIGTVTVANPNTPLCIYHHSTINDASGNSNGLMDYGETILLSVGIQNIGMQPATSVTALLSTSDPYITLTGNNQVYGLIPAGSTITVTDGFAFTVAADIPDGHSVQFILTMNDGPSQWTSNFSIQAHAPVLSYQSYSISDPGGNGNNQLDPGETVNMVITILNSGSASASGINGVLSCTSPWITISNSTLGYGSLPGGTTAQQIFQVTANPSTPAGTAAPFTLNINANLGISGSGSFSFNVGLIPVLIINLDGNNNAAVPIQNAITANNVACVTQTSFPANLSLYASIFLCLGIYDQNHVLTASEGQTLANYLNNGGRLYIEGGDTWYYDTQTAVHPLFKITGENDGSSDLDTLSGQPATFTAGMSFPYSGDNSWIDRINPTSGSSAFTFLKNGSPLYGSGIAYASPTYKTIGVSHEFAGLTNGAFPSTRNELMKKYLEFFGLISTQVPVNLAIGNYTGCSGLVSIPITATNFTGVASVSLVLDFNSGLQYQGYSNVHPSLANGNLLINQFGNMIFVSWVSISPVTIASGTLFQLNFLTANTGTYSITWNNQQSGNCEVTNLIGEAMLLNLTNGSVQITGQALPVSVTISTSSVWPVCESTLVVFTANPLNGGSNPLLNWYKNGVIAGNGLVYNATTLEDGDSIQVSLTSNQSCVSGNPALSDILVAEVLPSFTVSVMITASATSLCTGNEVFFTAYPTNGGNNPSCLWFNNGVLAGSGPVFNQSSPQNGDQVYCQVQSSLSNCVFGNPAQSNILTINVYQNPVIELGNDTMIPGNQTLLLDPGQGYAVYSWSTGATTPFLLVNTTGIYSVTVTSAEGCSSTDVINVVVGIGTVSGYLNYANLASTPLSNTIMQLKSGNTVVAQTTTAFDGYFLFENIIPGSYLLNTICTKPWGGANSTDALLIMKHFVGISLLTGINMKAGDVDATGMINAVDALAVQKRSVGMITSFPAGDWAFLKPTLQVTGQSPITLNVKGLCFGDVNGSFTPSGKMTPSVNLKNAGTLRTDQGDLLPFAVRVEEDLEVGAISLSLELPGGFPPVSDISGPINGDPVVWNQQGSTLGIAWYNIHGVSLSAGQPLVTLYLHHYQVDENPVSGQMKVSAGSEIANSQGFPYESVVLSIPHLLSSPSALQVTVYPNPMDEGMEIWLTVKESSGITGIIYTPEGKAVKTLVDGTLPLGGNRLYWDGRNDLGSGTGAGLYVLRITTKQEVFNIKLLKIK